jgi:hypothetical protein
LALIEKRRHEGEELLESLLGDLHTRRVVLWCSDRADRSFPASNQFDQAA